MEDLGRERVQEVAISRHVAHSYGFEVAHELDSPEHHVEHAPVDHLVFVLDSTDDELIDIQTDRYLSVLYSYLFV